MFIEIAGWLYNPNNIRSIGAVNDDQSIIKYNDGTWVYVDVKYSTLKNMLKKAGLLK